MTGPLGQPDHGPPSKKGLPELAHSLVSKDPLNVWMGGEASPVPRSSGVSPPVSGFSLVKALKSVTITPVYNALRFTEGYACVTASVLTHGSGRLAGLNRNNHSETFLSTCHVLDFS